MSDISVNIIKILNDNGVSVQIENIWGNTGTNPKVVRRNINLDFSEHDKVFEDKIAELKKDYKTASELLGKYQQENESLKKRIIELENFSCQAEQETESLFEKLKQRIAELESKESVKPMRIEFHADNGEMLTPLEVANSLITQNTFKVDELKELAEILEVYYRHHRDKNQDLDDLW